MKIPQLKLCPELLWKLLVFLTTWTEVSLLLSNNLRASSDHTVEAVSVFEWQIVKNHKESLDWHRRNSTLEGDGSSASVFASHVSWGPNTVPRYQQELTVWIPSPSVTLSLKVLLSCLRSIITSFGLDACNFRKLSLHRPTNAGRATGEDENSWFHFLWLFFRCFPGKLTRG